MKPSWSFGSSTSADSVILTSASAPSLVSETSKVNSPMSMRVFEVSRIGIPLTVGASGIAGFFTGRAAYPTLNSKFPPPPSTSKSPGGFHRTAAAASERALTVKVHDFPSFCCNVMLPPTATKTPGPPSIACSIAVVELEEPLHRGLARDDPVVRDRERRHPGGHDVGARRHVVRVRAQLGSVPAGQHVLERLDLLLHVDGRQRHRGQAHEQVDHRLGGLRVGVRSPDHVLDRLAGLPDVTGQRADRLEERDRVVVARAVGRCHVVDRRDRLEHDEQPRTPDPDVVGGPELQQRVRKLLAVHVTRPRSASPAPPAARRSCSRGRPAPGRSARGRDPTRRAMR